MSRNKIEITECVKRICDYLLDANELLQILIDAKNKYNSISIEIERENDYYDSINIYLKIYGTRYETDEEYNKRMNILYKRKKSNEQRRKTRISNAEKKKLEEIELLKRLHKKYPNEINI